VRSSLNMPTDTEALFERYSDSAGAYVVLDQTNVAIFKQMYRAPRRSTSSSSVSLSRRTPRRKRKRKVPSPPP